MAEFSTPTFETGSAATRSKSVLRQRNPLLGLAWHLLTCGYPCRAGLRCGEFYSELGNIHTGTPSPVSEFMEDEPSETRSRLETGLNGNAVLGA